VFESGAGSTVHGGGSARGETQAVFLAVGRKDKGGVLSSNEVGAKEKDLYGVCDATLISRMLQAWQMDLDLDLISTASHVQPLANVKSDSPD